MPQKTKAKLFEKLGAAEDYISGREAPITIACLYIFLYYITFLLMTLSGSCRWSLAGILIAGSMEQGIKLPHPAAVSKGCRKLFGQSRIKSLRPS